MIDERFDRDFQHARGQLARDFVEIAQAVGDAFRAMVAIQFDAPWSRSGRASKSDCSA